MVPFTYESGISKAVIFSIGLPASRDANLKADIMRIKLAARFDQRFLPSISKKTDLPPK